ncbi:MAG: hypothetical protein ABMA15_09875 [Vicinamibacterales bacterium]
MLTPRSTLTRRITAALDAMPSRIPVLLGGCGTGRTTLLHQVRDRVGRTEAQYVDLERTATTPERFLRALTSASPFAAPPPPMGARASFDAALAFFTGARAAGQAPVTFVLDEFLELRTFESFPGLRRVLYDFVDGLVASGNRFVLSSRYTARTLRLLRDRPARFEVIHVPPLTLEDTLDMLDLPDTSVGEDAEFIARTVHSLADGRPSYVNALSTGLRHLRERGGPGGDDAVSALTEQMSVGGRVAQACNFCYELRLHRARGYGALKAILEILADEEGLTLTAISQRLQRTPGSTKDYLSWLEDVDLVVSRQKRYSFVDSLLRVWVRLHCRPTPPTEEELVREVHRYALPRLPQPAEPAEPTMAMATAGAAPGEEDRKGWGIIEID